MPSQSRVVRQRLPPCDLRVPVQRRPGSRAASSAASGSRSKCAYSSRSSRTRASSGTSERDAVAIRACAPAGHPARAGCRPCGSRIRRRQDAPDRIDAARPTPGFRNLLARLRLRGQAAQHGATMAGERLEVEHLRTLQSELLQQAALAAAGRAADHLEVTGAAAGRRVRPSPRADTRGSRPRAAARASRRGRGCASSRRCGCRRASSRPAAASHAACRRSSPRGAARCCARPGGSATTRLERRLLAIHACRLPLRSASDSTGQLSAPGTMILGELAFAAHVDDRVEAVEVAQCVGRRDDVVLALHRGFADGRSNGRRCGQTLSSIRACAASFG